MNREEYLRDVVTLSFVRRITWDVVFQLIRTDDFFNLEDFSEFLTLQLLADPEAEIETAIYVQAPDDQIVMEENGRIRAAFPVAIDVRFERGQFSTRIPLNGFFELEGSSKDLEWRFAEAWIQLPTRKTFDFRVRETLLELTVTPVLEDSEEDKKMKSKKKR